VPIQYVVIFYEEKQRIGYIRLQNFAGYLLRVLILFHELKDMLV
jgi:hypothetical protein